MIELHDLKKRYRERVVLDIPKLCVPSGETLALAGANGSGKTTLLRILAGSLQPSEGTVEADTPILYLPQKPYAFHGTVLKNVLLGTRGKKNEARALLEQMELSHLETKRASSLSGGELQRMAFCRLMIRPCKLLLLDEPTSACDAHGAALLLQALAQYQNTTGCTVVLSTHTPAVAAKAANRLLILNNGKPEADGDPCEILRAPSSEWTKQFIAGWRI